MAASTSTATSTTGSRLRGRTTSTSVSNRCGTGPGRGGHSQTCSAHGRRRQPTERAHDGPAADEPCWIAAELSPAGVTRVVLGSGRPLGGADRELDSGIERWVSQDPARRRGAAEGIRQRFVSQATCWLRFAGRLQGPTAPPHPHSAEVAASVDHMRRERAWSEATIRYRRSRADEFLCRFCRRNRNLAEITIEAVDLALSDKKTRDGRARTRATIRNHADVQESHLISIIFISMARSLFFVILLPSSLSLP